jgi:hypothetical protein
MRFSNFNPLKILEFSQILCMKPLLQKLFQSDDASRIISSNHSIIYIYHKKNVACTSL